MHTPSPAEKDKEEDTTNTACFHFAVVGAPMKSAVELAAFEGETDADGGYTSAYSSSLVFEPYTEQQRAQHPNGGPVHADILVAKLAPGQAIKCDIRAKKGVGKDHAKFSPVATAAYRLATTVTLSEEAPFLGAEAEELVKRCPMGVFDIEDLGGGGGGGGGKGGKRAVAKRQRACTVCRECLRIEGAGERIRVERQSTHFIFTVESTGALPARELVRQALRVLGQKAKAVEDFVAANEAAMPELSPAEARARTVAVMREAGDEDG
jgi:DNA-directed RNA polymerase I and III subunit RPAC1